MKENNQCTDKRKEQELQEWLNLVHQGACCAAEDPHKEEKKKFLKSLKK